MKSVILIFLFIISFSTSSFGVDLDSLYKHSDAVISGQIISISGGFSDDLGTENYIVTIKIDSVYKQNFFINHGQTNLGWQVSNFKCKQQSMSNCISKFQNGKKIFFLHQAHFFGTEEIEDTCIFPFSNELENYISVIAEKNKLPTNPFYLNKTCDSTCEFCNAIKICNWKKVKKYIAQYSNRKTSINWMQHRNVKWILGDRVILASLPSYIGFRALFKTDSGEIETYIGYQLGYYHSYCSWIPYLAYKMWGAQWNKYFIRESTSAMILKSFQPHTNYSKDYLHYERLNDERMTIDTALFKFYSDTKIPISDELVLQAAVFDGEIQFYEDYKTMPDYLLRAKSYIQKLESEKKVFLLCIMATHTHPEIAILSLQALKRLNNPFCLPHLIELSKNRNFTYASSAEAVELQEKFQEEILTTIDSLTGCTTTFESVPSGFNGSFDIELKQAIWRKKIKQ
ncbi:MAG: hypothetical protein RL065_1280 [Bacteroidota bacterium]